LMKKLCKATWIRPFGRRSSRTFLRRHWADGVEWESLNGRCRPKASSWQKIRRCRGKHMEDRSGRLPLFSMVATINVLGCLRSERRLSPIQL
jgi:hypothetical protein